MTDCVCDYDQPDWSRIERRKAAKDHKCGECGRPIQKGERYEFSTGQYDGFISRHRTCSRCLEVRRYVQEHVPCFCWLYSDMLNIARETVAEYAHELPGLYFGWARRHIAAVGRRHERAT